MSEESQDDTKHPAGGLFADQKAELPEEWHDTFDALTAQGKSPSGITATIEYVTTPKTQQEVSREFNVSKVTIRKMQAAVVALGPIDAKRESVGGAGKQTAMQYCNHIADRLGWEQGVEYRVSDDNPSATPQPALRKAGWRSLFRAVSSQDDSGESPVDSSAKTDCDGG